MIDKKLLDAYRFHRYIAVGNCYPCKPGPNRACEAIKAARTDVANNVTRYGKADCWPSSGRSFEACGERHMIWMENVDQALRFVGLSHDISRQHGSRCIDHSGWYLRDDETDTVSGCVYQLPGKNGKPRYLAGYADPCTDNCACLSLDCVFIGEDADLEAARYADELARIMAEESRENDRAWCAGQEYADLGSEIADTRKATLSILQERRKVRGMEAEAPTLCATIRNAVSFNLSTIAKARAKRAELMSTYWDNESFQEAATDRA